MPLTEAARWTVAAALTAALTWASITDIRERKIFNRTVLMVLALFLPWAIAGTLAGAISDLEAGAIALIAGIAIYSAGWVGAGDAKLFAASSLFIGLKGLPALAMVAALAGGALALISLVSRPARAMTMVTLKGQGDFGRGVPYGVAIALAAAFLIWGALLHRLPAWVSA